MNTDLFRGLSMKQVFFIGTSFFNNRKVKIISIIVNRCKYSIFP